MNEKRIEKKSLSLAADILSYLAVALTAVASVLLCALVLKRASGFWHEHRALFTALAALAAASMSALAMIYAHKDKDFVFRLVLTVFIFVSIALFVLHILQLTGISEKISSVESLRDYVSGFGGHAVWVTLLMQVLQVVVLPIPGFIAVGATVALFGAMKGAIISFVGIVVGSFIGFFIGRKFGYGAAAWLVGEKSLKKGLDVVKGKDKAVLTAMFLLPFFPDDVLCFVAGLSSMSLPYFSVMILLTRAVSVFATAYSLSGDLIPYDTWWGIMIWAIVFIGTAYLSYIVYKHGEKLENFIVGKNKKRRK